MIHGTPIFRSLLSLVYPWTSLEVAHLLLNFLHDKWTTPPKTEMDTQNDALEKVVPFMAIFDIYVKFLGCKLLLITAARLPASYHVPKKGRVIW